MTASPSTLLVLGGTSDLGLAVGRAFAKRGWSVQLAARDVERAERNCADLRLSGAPAAEALFLDVSDIEALAPFAAGLSPLPDVVVSVVGDLGKDAEKSLDVKVSHRVMTVNYLGPATLLGAIGARMAERRSGVIAGVSSVAGERGRRSNFVYGSAKAGFTAYLSGLRAQLLQSGCQVISVIPGFMDTQMTADMDLPGVLTARPDEAAEHIWRAVDKGRDVVYIKPVWRWIMTAIKLIPEPIFKKMGM